MRRRLTVLVACTLGCVLIVGCGSSGPSSTGSTLGTSGTSGGSASNPAVAQAVAQCKSRINSQPNLRASLKTKLSALCDKAAHGDLSGAKQIAAQVCREIVNATVPKLGRGLALAACKKLG